jgi:hypothetical protein
MERSTPQTGPTADRAHHPADRFIAIDVRLSYASRRTAAQESELQRWSDFERQTDLQRWTDGREREVRWYKAAAGRESDDRAAISPAQTFTGSCNESSGFSARLRRHRMIPSSVRNCHPEAGLPDDARQRSTPRSSRPVGAEKVSGPCSTSL